ncbi:hypothetical protein BT63DRAFT_10110 [Microthyrium microscopicum]|uniref:Uncharacterized protein n=1 Tax=Microthyrium microscopicum TaxID=703497 RepID=A0A6A6UU20_9PEZI|nr:hypothetical protein BT63DRAFT_10110 [Microthyrium microscopicum]
MDGRPNVSRFETLSNDSWETTNFEYFDWCKDKTERLRFGASVRPGSRLSTHPHIQSTSIFSIGLIAPVVILSASHFQGILDVTVTSRVKGNILVLLSHSFDILASRHISVRQMFILTTRAFPLCGCSQKNVRMFKDGAGIGGRSNQWQLPRLLYEENGRLSYDDELK